MIYIEEKSNRILKRKTEKQTLSFVIYIGKPAKLKNLSATRLQGNKLLARKELSLLLLLKSLQ